MSKAKKRGTKAQACTGKIRYETASAAEVARWALHRSRKANGFFMRVYRCPFCGGWHVGHTRRK